MDAHVKRFVKTLQSFSDTHGGEVYETTTYDDAGNACELVPAVKLDMAGTVVNIVPFDVPGNQDHFSIMINAQMPFSLALRHEVRWDWVRKRLGSVEDHQIGMPEFDRAYLIGGSPAERVIHFLRKAQVQQDIRSLGDFLDLRADSDLFRVTLPIDELSIYTVESIQAAVTRMLSLAREAGD